VKFFLFLLFLCFSCCTPFHQTEIQKEHISKTIPIGIYVDNELSDEWNEALLFAIKEWNEKSGMDLFEIYVVERHKKYSNIVGITFIKKDKEEKLTYAKTYFIKDKFAFAVVINDEFSFISQKTKNFIMVHELGHVLGFMHEKDEKSIMYPNIPFMFHKDIRILEHHIEILKRVYRK
jgi:predicted Zn-dependent protease